MSAGLWYFYHNHWKSLDFAERFSLKRLPLKILSSNTDRVPNIRTALKILTGNYVKTVKVYMQHNTIGLFSMMHIFSQQSTAWLAIWGKVILEVASYFDGFYHNYCIIRKSSVKVHFKPSNDKSQRKKDAVFLEKRYGF